MLLILTTSCRHTVRTCDVITSTPTLFAPSQIRRGLAAAVRDVHGASARDKSVEHAQRRWCTQVSGQSVAFVRGARLHGIAGEAERGADAHTAFHHQASHRCDVHIFFVSAQMWFDNCMAHL